MISVCEKPFFQKLRDRLGKFTTAALLEADCGRKSCSCDYRRWTWRRWGHLTIVVLGTSNGIWRVRGGRIVAARARRCGVSRSSSIPVCSRWSWIRRSLAVRTVVCGGVDVQLGPGPMLVDWREIVRTWRRSIVLMLRGVLLLLLLLLLGVLLLPLGGAGGGCIRGLGRQRTGEIMDRREYERGHLVVCNWLVVGGSRVGARGLSVCTHTTESWIMWRK